ncbi:MAG: hypothetical protein ABSB35_23325 [Bryobacteraceae bacterium]|jgi:hypothetical protein
MATGINVISGPGIPLEVDSTFTLLGIRFWDLLQNLPVTDGLAVNLRLANSPAPPLNAVLTQSGVYAFFGLPGLRAVENQLDPADYRPPRTFRYIVTVQDLLGRYLPSVFVYTLDQTGAVIAGGSPPAPTTGVRLAYLFSAPTRPVPSGVGAVRASLVDRDLVVNGTYQAAAWAVVQVQVSGDAEVWTGISDASGQVLVPLPYPLLQRLQLGSPPGSSQGSIAGESWPITVQVMYNPSQLIFPLAGTADLVWPWTVTPNLRSMLENQPGATIWPDPATPSSQISASLTYGQDTVLRSLAGSPPATSSNLLISRGTSPP